MTLSITKLIGPAAAAIVLATGFASSAQAAPDGYCKLYAARAVQQNLKNEAKGCGFKGWRWHNWTKGHKKWCKGVTKAQAQAEYAARRSMLNGC